jgi:hypothetical protein
MQRVSWDLAQPEARIQRWCREHAVRCMALTPVFLRHRDGPRLHWVYDGHWTAAGHALAATTLAATVREAETVTRRDDKEGA